MQALLLASQNPGKILELQELLAPLEASLVTPAELDLRLEVVEDGVTYAQNAARKAVGFQRAAGMVVLADDSGLEVEALAGAPGLHSARFDPRPGATDADRRLRLLAALEGQPRPWTARFRCVVAVADAKGRLYFAEGECPGEITARERGGGGFGYDPLFLVAGQAKTMAELDLRTKNVISHRARAVRAILPVLRGLREG
jgi:XTP/dITP diphosphohydrolase